MMDYLDVLPGLALVICSWGLLALIPIGAYFVITRLRGPRRAKIGIALIVLSILSSPVWFPMVAFSIILFSGQSFS